MTPSKEIPRLACALVLGAILPACGPQFDSPGEIKSLRILAVQKDRPYARPGDEVKLKMLWTDGSEDAGRPIQIRWLSGCINPLGDLYQGCFAGGFMPMFGSGDEFSLTIPPDIITSRPPPPDPRLPPYGLSYVFFAACAGTFAEGNASSGFPLRCVDDAGRDLDTNDFVAGYSSIYVYDDFGNKNPIVRSITLDGKPLFGSCVDPMSAAAAESGELGPVLGGEAEGEGMNSEPLVVCDSAMLVDPQNPPDCDLPDAPCLTPQASDFFASSPLRLRPEVYASSVEHDDISEVAYGHDYEEQMWISYYATRGSFRSETRLLNDATTGVNEEFHTLFYPPGEPGPVELWAVVHDNRGGVAWARGSFWIP
jgi:hypothetical protein